MRDSAIACYWKPKSQGKNLDEPWYILTNLGNCEEAIAAYKARSGIEVRNALPLSSSN